MKSLFIALEIEKTYNNMSIDELAEEFEQYTNQKIPKEAIRQFKFMGLCPVDFVTSDWLNNYNLKNLQQFENIN
jgi:hypothetical protein